MFDDNEPRKKTAKPLDLSMMSIGELEERIEWLESEAARCRAAIESKRASHSVADAVFKKS